MTYTKAGFTLVELLISLIIVGILLAIAIPSYTDYIKQSRRTDAKTDLLSAVTAQEHYRSKNLTYGSTAQIFGGSTTSKQGYYTLAISNNTATGYSITATATDAGGQATDVEGSTNCSVLTITVSGLTTTQTPAACW